jgi:cytosine/adenosine deaminase-related metal-dependent hydrolase
MMILQRVKTVDGMEPVNIQVINGKVALVSSSAINDTGEAVSLGFDNALVFPGLTNSHDHLDFNLFPRLGNRIYSNYTEWGKDIHKTRKAEIAEVLKVPSLLRFQWGVYKNLLCGVTTVVNHGEPAGMKDAPITVFEDSHCLHSVQFDKKWKIRLNNPFKMKVPVNIHVGEGDDWSSFNEIDRLTRWNLLNRKLVGVHGVAMTETQAKKFEALVWCPQANFFLLNKTAPVNLLKKHTNLLFGTDSTLTGSWDIWEHLRLARQTKLLNDKTLYDALTRNAAKAWRLNSGEIAAGKHADLVVAKIKKDKTGFDAFFAIEPADILLVMHRGSISLFDETLLLQLKAVDLNGFDKIDIGGACKYVTGDLSGLMENIRTYDPAADFPVSNCQFA